MINYNCIYNYYIFNYIEIKLKYNNKFNVYNLYNILKELARNNSFDAQVSIYECRWTSVVA